MGSPSCRVCLFKAEPVEATHIFSHFSEGRVICDVLKEIAPVEIAKNDALPKIICSGCLQRLNDFWDLRTVIVHSDKKLREQVQCKSIVLGLHNQQSDCGNEAADEKATEVKVMVNSFGDHPLGVVQNRKHDWDFEEIDQKCIALEVVDNPLPDFIEVVKCEPNVESPQLNPSETTPHNLGDESVLGSSIESEPPEEEIPEIDLNTLTGILIDQKPFKCPLEGCGKSFSTKYAVRMHTLRHSTRPMPFLCDICGKGFPAKYMVNVHKAVHSDERKYKCPFKGCERDFRFHSALLTHQKTHLGVKKTHICDICGRPLCTSNALQNHLLIHKGELPFICEYCSRAFRTKGELCLHLKVHKGPLPTQSCPVCGKAYRKLKVHMKTHIYKEENGIECGICKKRFKAKMILDSHMKIHEDVKPFKCKVCNKSFRQSGVLWKHQRVHTGETPFHCAHCPRQFGYKHHLKTHIQKEHGVSPK